MNLVQDSQDTRSWGKPSDVFQLTRIHFQFIAPNPNTFFVAKTVKILLLAQGSFEFKLNYHLV